jgi:hypothetical protein
MRQTTHILRKDIRYLGREICLVFLLAALYAFRGDWWIEMLWGLAGIFLIARVIHAEALPGDRQFWLTRPYSRRSLFAAKLAFILLFVNLPLAVTQEIIANVAGFSPLSTVTGLIWNQILVLFCVSLPAAAVAAVTQSFVSFLLTTLPILIVSFSLTQFVTPLSIRLLSTSRPEAAEWVWQGFGVAALTALAAAVLWLQYAHRRTASSWMLMGGTAVAAASAYWLLPWSFPLAAESLIAAHASKPPAIEVAVDTVHTLAVVDPNGRSSRRYTDRKFLHIPLMIRGVPEDVEVRSDAITILATGPEGRSSRAVSANSPLALRRRDKVLLDEIVPVDGTFVDAERGRSVKMRLALYLSLFGDAGARTIPLSSQPVYALDGIQCYLGEFAELFCRSAFRWPERLVYAQGADGSLNSLYQLVSYSPFPAALSVNPIEEHWTSGLPQAAKQVTIISRRPIAHLRRDLELEGVQIAEVSGY